MRQFTPLSAITVQHTTVPVKNEFVDIPSRTFPVTLEILLTESAFCSNVQIVFGGESIYNISFGTGHMVSCTITRQSPDGDCNIIGTWCSIVAEANKPQPLSQFLFGQLPWLAQAVSQSKELQNALHL